MSGFAALAPFAGVVVVAYVWLAAAAWHYTPGRGRRTARRR